MHHPLRWPPTCMCLPLVGSNFGPPQTPPRRMQLCTPLVCSMHALFDAHYVTHIICSPSCFVLKYFCPPRFDAAKCGSACSPCSLEPLRQGLRFADGTDSTWYVIGGMSFFQLAAVTSSCRFRPSRFGPTRSHTPMGGPPDTCS